MAWLNMKIAVFTFLILFITALASEEQKGLKQTETFFCKVSKIEGNFGSYVPVEVGHTISFDLKQKKIKLEFKSKENKFSYVPTVAPMVKIESKVKWRSHQAFYLSERKYEDSLVNTQLILGVYGKVTEPLAKRPARGLIQAIHMAKNARWSLSEIDLACKLVK